MKPPKQKEIAEALGISASTVSRALNDALAHTVSDSLRHRIYDYIRAHSAALPTEVAASNLICLLVRKELAEAAYFNTLLSPVIRGLERGAARHGYHVVFKTWDTPEEISNVLQAADFSGVVVFSSPPLHGQPEVACARQLGLPVVMYGHPSNDCDTCNFDYTTFVFKGLNHLAEHGHDRIALAIFEYDTYKEVDEIPLGLRGAIGSYALEMEMAYYARMRMRNKPIDDAYIVRLSLSHPHVTYPEREEVRLWLERLMALPSRPTAVLCYNDYVAQIVMSVAQSELGLRVPADLSVVGCANIEAAETFSPSLTTFRESWEVMGQSMIDLLEARKNIAFDAGTFKHVLLQHNLVARDSVSVPGANSR